MISKLVIFYRHEPLNDLLNEPLNSKEIKLIELLSENPSMTYDQLVKNSGSSKSTVKRLMQGLIKKENIYRDGSKKTGKWKVLYKL